MISNTDKRFVRAVLAEKSRIDGRGVFAYRPINIKFQNSKGCCIVDVGKTKVLAQISWELASPAESRPNEGTLSVNAELNPLIGTFASEPNQQASTVQIIEINRLLERCLRESRCVDLESLCIESGSKIMAIRIDLQALYHDGNLVDAFAIAAMAALRHFRRPDVTYSGVEVTIHSEEDKDPLPLNILHAPFCTTFAFYKVDSSYTAIVVDPTALEEKVSDWMLTIAANKHQEICLMQTLGSDADTTKEQILLCCSIAIKRASEISDLISQSLESVTKK